ncbi:short-chain dehydrogenase [Flavobacterium rivuli WB 3.3-2 = DSM 21788]|uniref:Short-chain dehydrogenase n=1 Tax=Flavobacterium rivuli WB 3.3-2 = DSM 21788 TaxID=1121895 RepID=A0A0A2M033_9FLAO|nr:SDR family oxidoreductase [Flavobacterium rivuli]KGO85624.1 short-chain dehydrogenase [Flavobacterium rivuli WB 3.3-2 = DSM 21788]
MAKPEKLPAQEQEKQPGKEHKMNPDPEIIRDNYKGSGKLAGKKAFITGGDSGIGRSAAVHFAREGADVAIVYYNEHKDAEDTKALVEKEGSKCLIISGDLKDEGFCRQAVKDAAKELGGLNIIVNNAAVQYPQAEFKDITGDQVRETFETNIISFFYITREALNYIKEGDTIINTASVTAYRGSEHLIDYSSTKGAIVSFTRSTSAMLAEKGIRVNGVAPGPIWTPLIPSTFTAEQVAQFGQDVPMKRPGQPSEVGPAYVFLASEDASYITGQIIHINGGEVVGG